MTGKKQHYKYIVSDFIGSALTYTLFFAVRQMFFDIETRPFNQVIFNERYLTGLSIIPFFGLLVFYLSGYYQNVFRKSTIAELSQTFISIVIEAFFSILPLCLTI